MEAVAWGAEEAEAAWVARGQVLAPAAIASAPVVAIKCLTRPASPATR